MARRRDDRARQQVDFRSATVSTVSIANPAAAGPTRRPARSSQGTVSPDVVGAGVESVHAVIDAAERG